MNSPEHAKGCWSRQAYNSIYSRIQCIYVSPENFSDFVKEANKNSIYSRSQFREDIDFHREYDILDTNKGVLTIIGKLQLSRQDSYVYNN